MNRVNMVSKAFTVPVSMKLDNIIINISSAKIDIGCMHSLISYDSIRPMIMSKDDLFNESLCRSDYKISLGYGVESVAADFKDLKNNIDKIENIKNSNTGLSKNIVLGLVYRAVTSDELDKIKNAAQTRIAVPAKDVKFVDVNIGNTYVKIGLNTKGKVLIGMHLLSKLHMVMVGEDKNSTLDLIDRNYAGSYTMRYLLNLVYGNSK